MSILSNINSSKDLQGLSYYDLDLLSEEIREFIIKNVSETGGHLASNLGAVELTLALERVYDPEKDRIIFDVGHQCYTHKIINGRRDVFNTLRTYGGIAGFPRPYESDADSFSCGHSSNSISIALGMARARSLQNKDYDIAAVIGDGSLTGGLAFEGLENAAASKEPMVIILNDNAMSINRNVGGISRMLQNMRVRPGYISFKQRYREVVGIDTDFYMFSHKVKENIKSRIIPNNVFSELGLDYLGPVDGHNIKELETAIRLAKESKKTVLLHVITKKGKGYSYAEVSPNKYHGVGSFDPNTGEMMSSSVSFGDVMGKELCTLAEKDERITAITAAMTDGTGLESFSVRFPKRFFDVGICEGHAVSMAAGMAKQGLIPVFAVYSSFLQRAYDMLIQDVSLLNLHVVFCVDRAGLVGNDGETHHGTFDIAYLSSVPGMTILAPASFDELKTMLNTALYEYSGPVAVRYPRGGEGEYTSISHVPEELVREGSDITIVCYGTMINSVLKAADILAEKGISAEVVRCCVVKPNSFSTAIESVKKTKKLLVAEDAAAEGCLGAQLYCALGEKNINIDAVKLLNLGSGIVTHGDSAALYKLNKLDAEGISDTAMDVINGCKELADG